jgi:peptidoglycan/LPS O-acetylase OafA/YrhL
MDGRREIKPLTSLRFIFAILVFLCHCYIGEKPVFPEGFIGVEFFFILSGFIISYTYKDKILDRKFSFKEFFSARVARIYPLHLATFFIALMLIIRDFLKDQTALSELPWVKMFFNITLLQSFIPVHSFIFSFNIISWSISDELFFYLMFPLLIWFFNRHRAKTVITAGILALTLYFTAAFFVPERYHHAIFYINPFLRIYDFILGIALFHLYRYIKSLNIINKPAASEPAIKGKGVFSRKATATLVEIISVCLLVVMVIFSNRFPQVYSYGSYYWIPLALLVLCFTQLFGEGVITKILSLKPFVFLGKISFCFYMLHYMMIRLVPAAMRFVFKINTDLLNPAVKFTVVFASVLAASIICFYFFETPANKFVRKLLTGKNGRR